MSSLFQEEIKEMESKIHNIESFLRQTDVLKRKKLWEKNEGYFTKMLEESLKEREESTTPEENQHIK